jgi:hypothetical protein
MSLATHGKIAETHGLKTRILMLVAPLAALIYPFTLRGFNASVTTITSAGGNGGALPWITAAISLLIAFAVPTIALFMAMSFAEITAPTAAEVRAKRVALLAVATPTIFAFVGVILYMLGDPIPDSWALVVFWAVVAVMVARADNETLARTTVAPVPVGLRVAHGVSALAIVAIFLALHITNHLTGLVGPATYDAVMKVFRHVYRTELLQPVLVALFFFQIATGVYFVWRHTAAPSDRFRTFQIASGVYLAFYVLGHMNSVFVFARTYLGIDTGWGFATGAPTGLVQDAWNIRLVPHYALGVFFVLSHIAAGARVVMLNSGVRKALADRLMIGGVSAAGVIAVLIILGMCGLRLQFV